ncbi:glycosyltransferase [Crateriforma conspicua]|nr:glycosyltransferase [Crateriforma conspicua]
MNNSIVLFTDGFPYGTQEAFLGNEIRFLSEAFSSVRIVPLFMRKGVRGPLPSNVRVLPPVFVSRAKAMLAFARPSAWLTFAAAVSEGKLSSSRVRKSLKQSVIISALKSRMGCRWSDFEADLWYFYWGTNAVNVLPFLSSCPRSVARFHRFDLYEEDVEGGESQVFRERMLERLAAQCLVSADGMAYLNRMYGHLGLNPVLARLGVPDRGRGRGSEDGVLRLLTCSNVYAVKRVDLLASALSTVSGTRIEWVHFGDGPREYRDRVLKIASRFPSNVRLQFMGRRPNNEVMEFFRSNPIDLFLNVSVSEGLPVSIMEALSFGCPVMATDCGGVSELVGDLNGRLLPVQISPERLAREILDVGGRACGMREAARSSWDEEVNAEKNYREFFEFLKHRV